MKRTGGLRPWEDIPEAYCVIPGITDLWSAVEDVEIETCPGDPPISQEEYKEQLKTMPIHFGSRDRPPSCESLPQNQKSIRAASPNFR